MLTVEPFEYMFGCSNSFHFYFLQSELHEQEVPSILLESLIKPNIAMLLKDESKLVKFILKLVEVNAQLHRIYYHSVKTIYFRCTFLSLTTVPSIQGRLKYNILEQQVFTKLDSNKSKPNEGCSITQRWFTLAFFDFSYPRTKFY